MPTFNKLKTELASYLDKLQIKEIEKAYNFAKVAHEGQKRITGEPYITHPLEVCFILSDLRLDTQSLVVALLHDVIEDTPFTKQEITKEFGGQVSYLVDSVSKLDKLSFNSLAEAQAENYRKMLLAMVKDVRVIIIKMADRLHNMRTLYVMSQEKRKRIAKETLDIYAPIANRLGMHSFKEELEYLSFINLYPVRAKILRSALDKRLGSQKSAIKKIKKELDKKFQSLKIKDYKIDWREKNLYSIYKKMKTKRMSLDDITDVIAFRIEVADIDTCYRALGVAHNLYKPLLSKFKDYIAIPKVNNYQSLHTILLGPSGVPIECQIRTKEMHYLAEHGIAAHWLYKHPDASISNAYIRAREWFNSLEDMQNNVTSTLEFIESVKIDLFPEEVYVFTPKGDIIKLLKGSTVIDFAYEVHTDVGNTCVTSKVDKKIAPLSMELKSGQRVEIITSKKARPNPAWLHFVITSKAKNRIKHYIKDKKKIDAEKLGKRLLGSLINLKLIDNNLIDKLKKEYHIETINELYHDLGYGNRLVNLVAKYMKGQLENSDYVESNLKPVSIKGTEGLVVHFAECCMPIPGDPIVGIILKNQGVTIHTEQCSKINKYRDSYASFLHLNWAGNITREFSVKVNIEVENKKGMLAQLATAITEENANIENITTKDFDAKKYSLIIATLGVSDIKHLNQVIKKLLKLQNVSSVVRG